MVVLGDFPEVLDKPRRHIAALFHQIGSLVGGHNGLGDSLFASSGTMTIVRNHRRCDSMAVNSVFVPLLTAEIAAPEFWCTRETWLLSIVEHLNASVD